MARAVQDNLGVFYSILKEIRSSSFVFDEIREGELRLKESEVSSRFEYRIHCGSGESIQKR